ncbi:glycosyltransferase [Xenorhabdus szentirmaii]|uniref:glycosyltransferase n=2 Tax=Xenorhabdus szentirmaii TaxID=290112 RepID=UPI000C065A9D|nr:glycosyltransferase [Xenorhabdus szentirmaii]PHM43093.1 Glycosyltransferases involved in cell wall biogenesis [Xenorhabdus szentirmaii]
MERKPVLSVLMSVYNGDKYLEEAIDSILLQSFEDFEFIIINDGSTDSSASILSRYAEKDNRIRIITNENNIGLVCSLNKGLEAAFSNFIARMDADDIAVPERFQIQMDFMKSHPDIAVCGSFIRFLENSNKGEIYAINHEDIVSDSFFNCPFAHPTVIMRKDKVLNLANGYDPSELNAEDYGLWSRLIISKQVRFANIDKPLLNYRTHPSNPRVEYKNKQRKTAALIQRKMFSSLGINIPLEEISLINHVEGKIAIKDVEKCEFWLRELENATMNLDEVDKVAFLKAIKTKKMYLWRRIRKDSFFALLRYIIARAFYKK